MNSTQVKFPTADPSILDALRSFDSATVQNAAIFVRGYTPAEEDYSGPELRCMLPQTGTVAGYAMTAEKTVLRQVDDAAGNDAYYDSILRTDVPVIAVMVDIDDPPNRGAVWGDEMAHILAAMGVVGAVIGGCVRDVEGTGRAGCGLWATGRVPGHGPSSLVRHGKPVTVADLNIYPGDILVCDANGVTRITADIAADVVTMAEKVQAKEAATFDYFKQPDFTPQMYEQWRDSHGDGAWPQGARPSIPPTGQK